MKLEKEIFHKTPGLKPDSKSFEYKDNDQVSAGFQSGKNTVKGNQKGISCDLKDNKRDGLQLQYSMDDGDVLAAAEHRHSKSMDDLKTCKEYNANDFAVPFTKSPIGMKSIKKDSDYNSGKTITECDLPEFIVCYKESNDQAVKDICVDNGVPQEKAVSSFLFPDRDPNEHVIKDVVEFNMPVSNGLNSSKQQDSDMELFRHLESKEMEVEGDHEYDIAHLTVKEVSKDEVSLGDILSINECITENSNFTTKDGNSDEQEISQKESEITSGALVPAAVESNNCTNEIVGSLEPVSTAEESKDSSFVKGLLYNNEVDSITSSSIRLEFGPIAVIREERLQNRFYQCPKFENKSIVDYVSSDSHVVSSQVQRESEEERSQNYVPECDEAPNASLVDEVTLHSEIVSSQVQHDVATEEYPHKGNTEHNFETQNMSLIEDGINGFPAISCQDQNEQGESSFSGVHHLSSLIHYSGQMTSGNVSLRSDSSTTSTRSFAFPVLQPEWNCSPIKMAKADRRSFRKHRSWRQGILCCRF